jgi:hypothetical protein
MQYAPFLAEGGDGASFGVLGGFPGGEVIASISDSDGFVLAEAETGANIVKGSLSPRRQHIRRQSTYETRPVQDFRWIVLSWKT